MLKTRKVVIVGAGHVGSHVALALIQSGEADDIVLIDILKEKAAAQALDLDDCVSGALCGRDAIIRAGEYSELNDADILVMAFGRSRRPGETRLDMFDDSIKMANEVISHLKQVDFKGIMISISNPADIKITLLTTDTDGAKKQAEVLQEQYQKNLGITVEINQVTYKQRLQMETEKDYDMVVTGWVPDYSDAYSYLELWISDGKYNHSGYANAEYDKLLKDSQTETDAKTRQDMLFQAEKIFLEEDSALVPLQLRRDQYLINPKISNFNVYFVGYDFDLVYADISE